MRALGRWLLAGLVLLLGRQRERQGPEPPPRETHPGTELLVLTLLGAATAGSAAFVVVYFLGANTQLLGLTIGLAFAALAAAAIVASQVLVPQDEHAEERPKLGDEEAQDQVLEEVERGGETITRKRLLLTAAGGAGAALGGALLVPALSLGPEANERLTRSPWRAGRLLVDEGGAPLEAGAIEFGTFRTAFPEGADKRDLAAPVVVVRIPPNQLDLPSERADWAPLGILAFSKICTHAGCAIALFRYPLYEPRSAGPALVCPCHYSTFDVRTGGHRVFGPAGRALPQLPLALDDDRRLVAAGDFSGRVGPSWWGVRKG
jgi:ubiquinol-cytochrome c reductase iron-sulfur subunit